MSDFVFNAWYAAGFPHEIGETMLARRLLDLPVLIVDGAEDIRPRWAVDSLHEALPNVERVSLAGAGHLPWVERRDGFSRTVTTFLTNNGFTASDR